ncbi:MAG: amidohydrolase family protein [Clostridia bacterium]|nr:amidohydrolase family protein [Clostridia bacterium]
MPTARLMGEGIKLGFGSDVSAGQSLKIYSQIARAVQLSKIKEFYEPENRSISFEQAFYIATKSSGAVFGKTGTFEKGYSFDALVIDGLDDGFVSLSPKQIAERFCYAGAKENIRARFLRGEEIKI